jgi:hypothetical protein
VANSRVAIKKITFEEKVNTLKNDVMFLFAVKMKSKCSASACVYQIVFLFFRENTPKNIVIIHFATHFSGIFIWAKHS